MLKTSASIALIFCASYALAQEASVSSGSASSSAASASAAVVSGTQSANLIDSEATQVDVSEAFAIPGGYGNAPLNFTPGQGHFDRPPLQFSTTLQLGYDDNIYCTNNQNPFEKPVKGSMITSLSQGVDLLLAQDRLGLSLGGNFGGQYYWDHEGQHLFPTGGLDLIFGYKISPQTQLSVQTSVAYLVQPSFSVLSGLTDANGKGYFTGNTKVDLLHRWTPRFSTDTTYLVYGTYYSDSEQQNNNHISQTLGESLRYMFTRNFTGVIEGRANEDTYDGDGSNSQSYFALVGGDLTLTRRLSSSIRLGAQTRTPDTGGSKTSPYLETSVNYVLTRTTLLGWQARYGFEDTGSSSGSQKSFRTGVSVTQSITTKLRGTVGLNFMNDDAYYTENGDLGSNSYSAVSASVGLNYAYSKDVTLFANYSRIDKNSPSDWISYDKDVYYIGATLQY